MTDAIHEDQFSVGDILRNTATGETFSVTTTHAVTEWIEDGRIYRRENDGPVVELGPGESGLVCGLPGWLVEKFIAPELIEQGEVDSLD